MASAGACEKLPSHELVHHTPSRQVKDSLIHSRRSLRLPTTDAEHPFQTPLALHASVIQPYDKLAEIGFATSIRAAFHLGQIGGRVC